MNVLIGNELRFSAQEKPEIKPGGFTDTVQSALKHIQYRRAESGDDLESIYKLRYYAYKASGLIEGCESHLFHDEYDNTENCRKFCVYYDDMLVSTLRVHYLTLEHPHSPAMSVFPDLLLPRLEAGDTFIDPSRLAADPAWTSIIPQLPFLTLRLAVAATDYFRATSCLAMVRDDHIAFYRRYFHAERIGEPRVYPSVTVLGHLFESSRELNLKRTLDRFPFFRSTALERRLLFGCFEDNAKLPISIIPGIGAED